MVQAAHQVASPRQSGERQPPPPNPRSSNRLTEETASGLSLEEQVRLSIERKTGGQHRSQRTGTEVCLEDKLVGADVPCGGGTHHAQFGGGNRKLQKELRLITHIKSGAKDGF